ncbi:MAG: hypothetical protein HYX61_00775 [Gammaproteobacteria bacterium]|jgi:hypothetical protein|nr:hypothetical protein [Gammaproteobacteria bacterium]
MKLGVTDIIQSYYQQKGEEPLSLEDLTLIENNNPDISKDTVTMAKMQILSDILCTKKAKKSSQQLFLFLPPMVKLLEQATLPQASEELREFTNDLRNSKALIHAVIRMTSNALYEIAKVISGYEDHFRNIKINFNENAKAILRANRQLKSAVSFIKRALNNIFDLYHQKMSSMSPTDLGLFAKLLYALQNNQTLNLNEFKEAVQLLTNLVSFSEQDIQTLVDAMSLYQSLLIMDGLKKTPMKNELSLSDFSTLFQAPMRHPMLMTQMITAFKNLSLFTKENTAQDCKNVLFESQEKLDVTKACLEKVNFLFSNNYVIDASFVNEFLTLRQLLSKRKIPSSQTKFLDELIHTLQWFVHKNNVYFLNKNQISKDEFHEAFVKLKQMHAFISQDGYAALFQGFINDQELDLQFVHITGISLKDFIQKIESSINQGLHLYLRQDNFEEYKANAIERLIIELGEIHLACSMLDNEEIKLNAIQLDMMLKTLSQDVQEDNNQKAEWVQAYGHICERMKEIQSLVKSAVAETEPVYSLKSLSLTHQFDHSKAVIELSSSEDISEQSIDKSSRYNSFL